MVVARVRAESTVAARADTVKMIDELTIRPPHNPTSARNSLRPRWYVARAVATPNTADQNLAPSSFTPNSPKPLIIVQNIKGGLSGNIWPLNRWITAMLRLFQPQIIELLRQRDETVAAWQRKNPERNVYEDRDLDITSQCPVSVDEQIALVDDSNQALLKFKWVEGYEG